MKIPPWTFHLSCSPSPHSFWYPPHRAPLRNHPDLVSIRSTTPTTSTTSSADAPTLHPPPNRRTWTRWTTRCPASSKRGSPGGVTTEAWRIKVRVGMSSRSTTAWTLRANERCCCRGPRPGLTTRGDTPSRCSRLWRAAPSAVPSPLASSREPTVCNSSPHHAHARKKWAPRASLWIRRRVRSFQGAFTQHHLSYHTGTLAWGDVLHLVNPRTLSIWVEERRLCLKMVFPTPSSWLYLASHLRKQAPSTEHWLVHEPTHTIARIHTHTWCTLCIRDGDSHSNNILESNNATTVNTPWGIVTIPCIVSLLPKENKRTCWGSNKLIIRLSLLKDLMTSLRMSARSLRERVPFWLLGRIHTALYRWTPLWALMKVQSNMNVLETLFS